MEVDSQGEKNTGVLAGEKTRETEEELIVSGRDKMGQSQRLFLSCYLSTWREQKPHLCIFKVN